LPRWQSETLNWRGNEVRSRSRADGALGMHEAIAAGDRDLGILRLSAAHLW
jgi:hypothetical protein